MTTANRINAFPIAGLAAVPTFYGPNAYLRAAEGVHLPTFAEQALAWNAHSAAPAERIVINAQQWGVAPSLPSTDAEQLSRLAQRFQTAIDLKSRGGVQEFVSAEELSRQETTGPMVAMGKEGRSGRALREEIRTFLLGKDPRPMNVPEDRFQGPKHEPLLERFSACDRLELGGHLIALLRKNDEGIKAAAAMELLRLGGPLVPVNVSHEEWKACNVELIHALLAMEGFPGIVKQELKSRFETYRPLQEDLTYQGWWHWTWMRDVFIRVLNDPDEARRTRARDFFDAHQWIKEARPLEGRSLAETFIWDYKTEAIWRCHHELRFADSLVNDVHRALSKDRSPKRHGVDEVIDLASNATPEMIAGLIADLWSEEPHVVRVAAAALGRIDDAFHHMIDRGKRFQEAIAVRDAVTRVLRDASLKEEHRFFILREFLLRASQNSIVHFVRRYQFERGLVSKALNHTLERI